MKMTDKQLTGLSDKINQLVEAEPFIFLLMDKSAGYPLSITNMNHTEVYENVSTWLGWFKQKYLS